MGKQPGKNGGVSVNDEIMKVLEAAGRRIADLEIEVDCKNFEIENLKKSN